MEKRFEIVQEIGNNNVSEVLHRTKTSGDALKWLNETHGTNTGMIQHIEASRQFFEHWLVPIGKKQFMVIGY